MGGSRGRLTTLGLWGVSAPDLTALRVFAALAAEALLAREGEAFLAGLAG